MKKVKASRNKAKDVERKPIPPIGMLPQRQPDHRQALEFIDQCVAMASLGRQQHIQAQRALQQIGGAVTELEQLKNELEQLKKEKQNAK